MAGAVSLEPSFFLMIVMELCDAGRTLPCASAAFVPEAVPLPCAFPLVCVPKTAPFLAALHCLRAKDSAFPGGPSRRPLRSDQH